jgi:hypothetical protein
VARVICISRARGALGEELGRLVADELGFRYVDEEIVSLAASREGIDRDLVADAERRKSFFARALEEFGRSSAGAYAFGGPPLEGDDQHRGLIREAIAETAAEGDVVIVSHAASYALGPQDGVFRVLVTASAETRAKRLGESERLDPEEASDLVRQSDRNRADYLRRFYEVEDEDPAHYDLVVNTDRLSAERAAAIVVAAAR